MRIDLACKHLKFHLLLLVGKLLFLEQHFVHLRIFFFNILHHDFQIGESLRELILSPHHFFKIIVFVACLIHHMAQGPYPSRKILPKVIDQDARYKHRDQYD